jgi:hypothetical protein
MQESSITHFLLVTDFETLLNGNPTFRNLSIDMQTRIETDAWDDSIQIMPVT